VNSAAALVPGTMKAGGVDVEPAFLSASVGAGSILEVDLGLTFIFAAGFLTVGFFLTDDLGFEDFFEFFGVADFLDVVFFELAIFRVMSY
jgi:uncharacterized membrane protein YhdT